eukprot:7281996-Prorocentrum_lima.AAC.1
MTSSLVGSEMCIRDRSMTNGRNETLTTTEIANAFLNASINKDAVVRASACLLYTSDAADDM